MALEIVFTNMLGVCSDYAPIPAEKMLPDWYKNTPSYIDNNPLVVDGKLGHTIKKCVPVFDALTAGYLIITFVDVQVTQVDGQPFFQWPSHNPIGGHPMIQAENHPIQNGSPFAKWNNPWAIRTPPGYSCLFVPPMHNPNGIFTILPGITDTDNYRAPVNFPFVLDDPKWEGTIPVGTPIAQVLPFRRDSWKMSIGDDKDVRAATKDLIRLTSRWRNAYKTMFWSRKQYR